MNIIDFDPAIETTLYLRKNRGGAKHFTFTTPNPDPLGETPIPYSLAEYDRIDFYFKRAGRTLFTKTLAVSGVDNNELDVVFSDEITYNPGKNYSWELVFLSSDFEQTWLTGKAVILADGETYEELEQSTDLTVILSNNEVSVNVTNPLTLTIDNSFIYNFSYGDATPFKIYTLNANKMLISSTIIYTEIFDGIGDSVTLGTAIENDLFMTAEQSNPTELSAFQVYPYFKDSVETDIYLTINLNSSTQGAGTIIIEIAD